MEASTPTPEPSRMIPGRHHDRSPPPSSPARWRAQKATVPPPCRKVEPPRANRGDQHRDEQPFAPGEGAHRGPDPGIQRPALHGHRQKAADDEYEQCHVRRSGKPLDGRLEHIEYPLAGGEFPVTAGYRSSRSSSAVIHGRCCHRLLGLGRHILYFSRRQHPGEGPTG